MEVSEFPTNQSPDWRKAAQGNCDKLGRAMNRRDFLRSASAMSAALVLPNPQTTDSELLDNLRRNIVAYYRNEANPRTGLIADKTQPGSASSIAAVGMGLSVYIVAVERGIISRAEGVNRTLTLLRFLHSSHQGPEPDATGYKGFYSTSWTCRPAGEPTNVKCRRLILQS